jgi:hypothetical protein
MGKGVREVHQQRESDHDCHNVFDHGTIVVRRDR